MFVRPLFFAALVAVAGCAASSDMAPAPQDASTSDQVNLEAWRADFLAEGEAVYRERCAQCHAPGASDAPAVGVREDWDERSRLWTAVLFQHARHGYLEMPPRGGSLDVTERQVDAAAEYMLTVTYPELPID